MAATHLNADQFQKEVLDVKNMPVLVDFWAPWCGPCTVQGPIIDELAVEMKDKARIFKVNVDDNGELAGKYNIMSIPALKVFKNGEEVGEMVGVHQKKQLVAMLEKHL